MTVIERILLTAKSNQLTQASLAKELSEIVLEFNITKQTISDWKNGKSNSYYYCMPQLATILNTSTDYLLTGKEPTPQVISVPAQEQNTSYSSIEIDLLELFNQLPERKQYELIGELKGYIKCMEEITPPSKDAVS